MTIQDDMKEMIDTWTEIIVNQQRELTEDENNHILKIQDRIIKKMKSEADGLSEEEAWAENFANHRLDYFKDRDKLKRQ